MCFTKSPCSANFQMPLLVLAVLFLWLFSFVMQDVNFRPTTLYKYPEENADYVHFYCVPKQMLR